MAKLGPIEHRTADEIFHAVIRVLRPEDPTAEALHALMSAAVSVYANFYVIGGDAPIQALSKEAYIEDTSAWFRKSLTEYIAILQTPTTKSH